jgi:hypothetical protein
MQRLNLVPPDPRPAPSRSEAPQPSVSPLLPPADPEAVKEVERRKDLILKSGQVPEWIFICGVSNGVLTVQSGAGKKPLMLLFMTPYAASDYIRATRAAAEVKQLKLSSMPEIAGRWMAAGVEGFILNRCPRCNVCLMISIEALKERAAFLQVWAMRRATQLYQGQIKVLEYIENQSKSRPGGRAILEMIRDHIDGSVPYLHELIALHARIDQDEAAKAEALERLKEFGPQFTDWESRWDQSSGASSPYVKSLSMAMLGLATSFGIEFKAPSATNT